MPNNPIDKEIKERIEELADEGWTINRIAKETGTSRPTVRKYGFQTIRKNRN